MKGFKMGDEIILTVKENPFNPFTQWDEWNRWDEDKGYFTNSLLARVTFTTTELSEAIEDEMVLDGMQRIVALFPETYKIVSPKDYEN